MLNRRSARTLAQHTRSDGEVKSLLEQIYRELMNLGDFISAHRRTVQNLPNPFIDQDRQHRNMNRYRVAVLFLGLEYLVIPMHSETFRNRIFNDTDAQWTQLKEQVGLNRHSLRMWAITCGVPYVANYEASHHPQDDGFGPLAPHPLALVDNPPHRHLVYEALPDGDIRTCTFTERRVLTRGAAVGTTREITMDMQDHEDNIYTPHELARRKKNVNSWPPGWDWPSDPQKANKDRDPPFCKCEWCEETIVTWPELKANNNIEQCTCDREEFLHAKPMVQIKEFPPFPNALDTINRGVVARSKILCHQAIGEYIGHFIHVDTFDQSPDQIYQFEFKGPKAIDPSTNEWDFMPTTSGLIAGWRGNWTRFINADRSPTNERQNVEFKMSTIGGQLRILVWAIKDIEFGEELLADYGPSYFLAQDAQDEAEYGYYNESL